MPVDSAATHKKRKKRLHNLKKNSQNFTRKLLFKVYYTNHDKTIFKHITLEQTQTDCILADHYSKQKHLL